jgi:glycine cleavage system transcriptional repressor
MAQWFMLTLVGKDQIGIVAKVTTALYQSGCHLGEASMLRMDGNFTIMLMVHFPGTDAALTALLAPIADELQLHVHLDPSVGEHTTRQEPDVQISVHSADRAGIVAQVTSVLAAAGLNILDLESDIGGSADNPFYVMQIEGIATQGIEALQKALQTWRQTNEPPIEVRLTPITAAIL